MDSNSTSLNRSSRLVPPVRHGETIEVSVTGLNHEGEGVARIDGFALFLPGALAGERVRARITTVKKNYGRGQVLEIMIPSPARTSPVCQVFGECGGCQLQHLDYSEQLELKRRLVTDALERIGHLKGIRVEPTMGMEEPWRYRNKAQYPVKSVAVAGAGPGRVLGGRIERERTAQKGKGLTGERKGLVGGFYARGTHVIVPCEDCRIQHPLSGMILRETLALAGQAGLEAYDEKTGEGFLRHVIIKIGFFTGEAMVVLVTNGEGFPHGEALGKSLHDAIPAVCSVVQNINTRRTNVILGDRFRVLWGKDHIEDVLGGLRFRISAGSFYQVNPAQAEVLYRKVVEFAGLSGNEVALDLYCGVGTITLFLAQRVKKAYGVEAVASAIEDARVNAGLNHIDNVEFLQGDAAAALGQLLEQGVKVDVLVLDPPKSGCDRAVVEASSRAGIPRIIYVSCNPASLARDLERLTLSGYRVRVIQPVDMFPQTSHVESVALLERTGPGPSPAPG
ncbi:MAG TPA: 23S rRNA (uracil(1939)-C(5))-methyltransferase RlmD [Firmicutes bacterium]|nr:23S rRNA (uracil(1939)-C(5))-methyltransferase RlmD [Bacillota bacterium]